MWCLTLTERFITMPIKFAILGDGAWGTAIGILLAGHPDHRVSLWSAREDNAGVLRERRENVVYLPGVPIPSAIELTTDVGQSTQLRTVSPNNLHQIFADLRKRLREESED